MAPPTGEKASHASRGCVGVAKLRQHQHSLIASLRSGYVSNSNPFKVFIRSRPCAAVQKVINVSRIGPIPPKHACGKFQVHVHSLELGKRRVRLFDPPKLGQPGDDIAQADRPIPVERPGASPGFDSLRIMPHLVVRPSQRGKPDEHARTLGLSRMPFSACSMASPRRPA